MNEIKEALLKKEEDRKKREQEEMLRQERGPLQVKGSNNLVKEEVVEEKENPKVSSYVLLDKEATQITINNPQKFEEEYNKFFKDHPEKGSPKIEHFSFNSLDELKKSEFYNSLPESEKLKISKESKFPIQMTVYHFASKEDALEFLKQMEDKKIVEPKTTKNVEEQSKKNQESDDDTHDEDYKSSFKC